MRGPSDSTFGGVGKPSETTVLPLQRGDFGAGESQLDQPSSISSIAGAANESGRETFRETVEPRLALRTLLTSGDEAFTSGFGDESPERGFLTLG